MNVGKIATKTRIPGVDDGTVQPFFIYLPEKECELLRTESAQLDDAPSTDFASEHDAAAVAVLIATKDRQENKASKMADRPTNARQAAGAYGRKMKHVPRTSAKIRMCVCAPAQKTRKVQKSQWRMKSSDGARAHFISTISTALLRTDYGVQNTDDTTTAIRYC